MTTPAHPRRIVNKDAFYKSFLQIFINEKSLLTIMKKRLALILLFMILLPLAIAELEIEFTSLDKEDFNGYLLSLKFGDAVYKELMDDNIVKVPTNQMGSFTATLDSSKTAAIDYSGTITIDQEKTEFLVYPSGYLKGKVMDLAGNLIPNAQLNFNCYSEFSFNYPERVDAIGFFTVKNVPVGSCSVVASKNELVGNTEFKIEKGQVTSIEITLGESVARKSNFVVWLLVILLVIMAILLSIRLILQKKPKKEKKKKKQEKNEKFEDKIEEKLSKQTQALMKILSEKERKIVDFLLENGYNASQAKIRHNTKIPRTSLTRVLQSLEKKKIAEIEKEGKMVSVKLTKFFLGKE